jgi:hypothetical protein
MVRLAAGYKSEREHRRGDLGKGAYVSRDAPRHWPLATASEDRGNLDVPDNDQGRDSFGSLSVHRLDVVRYPPFVCLSIPSNILLSYSLHSLHSPHRSIPTTFKSALSVLRFSSGGFPLPFPPPLGA